MTKTRMNNPYLPARSSQVGEEPIEKQLWTVYQDEGKV